MADLLAIEWGEQRVRGIAAREDRGGLRVTGGFDEAWPENALPTRDPGAAGRWLSELVKGAGFSGREVRVSVARASTVVRRLDLPAVPPDELPPMVEMQAATRSAAGLEGLALDFVPITDPTGEGQSVLAATTNRKLVDSIVATCEAAGLRTAWIGLSPLATAELVVRATRRAEEETVLLVSVHDQSLETTLVRGRRVQFSLASELHAEGDEPIGRAVAAAIRRALVAQGGGLSAATLDHVWWIGDPAGTAAHREVVARQLNVPVEPFDPLANDRVRSETSGIDSAVVGGAVGTLLVPSGPLVEQVDFLDPRKPPKKVDQARRRRILAAAVGGGLLLLLLVWRQWTIWSLGSEIARLEAEEGALAAYNDANRQKIVADADRVLEWQRLRRDWLDDIARLEDEVPERDRALLTEMTIESGTRNPLGRISGKGKARSRDEVGEYFTRLSQLGYEVHGWKVEPSRAGGEYGFQFDFDVTLPDPNAKPAASGKGASS